MRTYHDRLGRPLTDPSAIEARRIQTQLRRLVTLGVKAGRAWDNAVTVGQLARAAKTTPERIVEVIRTYNVWLWAFVENDGPIEGWGVYEDGE